MKEPSSLPTQQIGELGELLTQYQLLRFGIESAQLTTDSGIDLVAYSPHKKEALTIQVKANHKPRPGGGRGHLSFEWTVRDNSPADLFSFVDVSENRIWLFTKEELSHIAQQHSKKGNFHFYIYIVSKSKLKGPKGVAAHISNFEKYRLESRIEELFLNNK